MHGLPEDVIGYPAAGSAGYLRAEWGLTGHGWWAGWCPGLSVGCGRLRGQSVAGRFRVRDSYAVEEFVGHSERCDQQSEGLLDDGWDEFVDIPVRVHLLDRWLGEDGPAGSGVLAAARTTGQDVELTPEALPGSGLFGAVDSAGRVRREPRACRTVPVAEAASAVERALRAGGGTPSRRVALLAADLRAVLDAEGREAALVTVADPATGAVAEDETHVVLSWNGGLVRVSVVPRPGGGEPIDPACSFAGCPDGARIAPEEHGLTEARGRAVCAGTVLAALLGCDGRAAFSVGWRPHGIDPGHPDRLTAVRAWWESTPWHDQYPDDHMDVYYDYGAGDWLGRHRHLAPTPEQIADEDGDDYPGRDCLVLADPAEPRAEGWFAVGDPMLPLDGGTLLAQVEAFRAACREQAAAPGELVDPLIDELLAGPLERVGGPERRMLAWADAVGTGAFWHDADGTVDVHEDARRLLVVGEREALYLVFRGEMGA
ncbi:hypothetical protein GCM10027168_35980 [Streptomyces capparidis]